MKFEFDYAKSLKNKEKHGIDFTQASKLWDSPVVTLITDHKDEPRQLHVGIIQGKSWTAIVTLRGKTIRIISVRRSRKNEEAIYKQEIRKTL